MLLVFKQLQRVLAPNGVAPLDSYPENATRGGNQVPSGLDELEEARVEAPLDSYLENASTMVSEEATQRPVFSIYLTENVEIYNSGGFLMKT